MTKILMAMVLALGLSQAGCIGCMPNYSDGDRTGTVVKLSYKGFIKSWEGSLHLGQSQITGGNDTWNFSLKAGSGDDMAHQLQEAQRTGKVVTLHYHQWALNPYTIDTDYEVDRIDEAK